MVISIFISTTKNVLCSTQTASWLKSSRKQQNKNNDEDKDDENIYAIETQSNNAKEERTGEWSKKIRYSLKNKKKPSYWFMNIVYTQSKFTK